MFKALRRTHELFVMETGLDKIDDNADEFSPFRDYLGLINLIQPHSYSTALESPTWERNNGFEFRRVQAFRNRMDSLESDSISDSSSSVGSRSETEAMYDNLSGSGEFLANFSQSKPSVCDINVLTQSYAKTLETIIAAQQKNVLNRLSPSVGKDKNGKAAAKTTVCVFCRNNGESREFYSSHTLKDNEGNTTCPILRAYTCPLCKANGDNSHTIKYCPKYTPKLKTDKLLSFGL